MVKMKGFRQAILPATGTLAVLLATGCGGQPQPQRSAPPDAKRVDESRAGRISGRVTIGGPVPKEAPIAIPSDHQVCLRDSKDAVTSEAFVVDGGGLNNVFVYMKDGLGNYYFDTPAEAVKLDQQGCRYKPHVFGVRTGQPIEISNSDPTPHNVSATGTVNRGFNFGQAMQGLRNTQSFTAPEVMVRFKCDIHGWMSAFAGVVEHPYFAVTADGGTFELKNVPAGTYTIEAWHEKLGTQTQSVTIKEKESKDLAFTFKTATTNE